MTPHARYLLAGLLLALATPLPAQDIPFQRFVLANGLTLIVHEDHKVPIVAVNVWYHVGSKNERPGRTGFAHLFEHLMFNGSEHHGGEYYTPFEQAGGTDMNGSTSEDRTNYFQNVPTPALDLALWMESDRMGHLLGAIDQAKLDEQRGVVQNEKRQGENEPYGGVWGFLAPRLYPPNHPYSWEVIGSMDDLDAAKLEDVKDWFRSYYGAANAVVSVAGDVDAQTVKRKVEEYFGEIPGGPPVARPVVSIAKRSGHERAVMQDRVPQPRIYRVWNIPQWGSADGDYLRLVADVLAKGKTSRLYRRLVYRDQIATNVSAGAGLREIGGLFTIEATAPPGGDLSKVERAIDEELAWLLKEGPKPDEVARVKTQYRAGFIRGAERIGGFGGKSEVLAESEVFGGSPDAFRVTLQRVASAAPADLLAAARRWLTDGDYTLEVRPFPEHQTVASRIDRSRLPAVDSFPPTEFPRLDRATLSNGLKIVLAERPSIPQVRFDLLFDAGSAADRSGLPGIARLTLGMLDEGTTGRSSLQISETLARLGSRLESRSTLDASIVSLEALKENLDSSLALYADVILDPSFPQGDLDRLKRQQLAAIAQEEAEPSGAGLRLLPSLLYGPTHAYGLPWNGYGSEESVRRITRQDVKRFYRTWFRPNHATLVVVGATTMAEIRPKLERLFGKWSAGDIPAKNLAAVADSAPTAVYLIDRPGAIQSTIFAATVGPPKRNPDELAIETMNRVLGGYFGSRINMNLREGKHWSYGAYTMLPDAQGPRPFAVYAPVQTDKTAEAIVEIGNELRGILGGRPVTGAELSQAKATLTLTLPGRWETMEAVSRAIQTIVTYGLDDRYYDGYRGRIASVGEAEIPKVAASMIHPDRLVWVVVGDRAKIETKIRDLKLGEVRVVDAAGARLNAPTP